MFIRRVVMKIIIFLFMIITAALPRRVLPAESIEAGGYYKNFSVLIDPAAYSGYPYPPANDLTGFVNNRLRIQLDLALTGRLSFTAAYDFAPRLQDRSYSEERFAVNILGSNSYRFADLDNPLYPSKPENAESFIISHNLDRAFLAIDAGIADIYIGRQAVAWGSARSVNPTDIIAPFSFDEMDSEDRFGVDAFRIRIPTGPLGEIDAGYVAGKDFRLERSAVYSRIKLYFLRTDASVMIAAFRENLLAGIDLSRAIGGAGAWIEAAYVWEDAAAKRSSDDSNDYLRFTAGCDYSFSGKLYGFIEYHFNQAGAGGADGYSRVIQSAAFREGGVYLLGSHYLCPGVTYQFTPLLSLDSSILVNVEDPSLLFAPTVEFNVAEDIYLSSGAFVGFGDTRIDSGFISPPPSPVFPSEFGSYPDVYFASFRIYF